MSGRFFTAPLLAACAALAACSVTAADSGMPPEDPTPTGEGASPGPNDPERDAFAPEPGSPGEAGGEGGAPKPERPPAQATVRDCGSALTTPTRLQTHVAWVPFLKTPIGAGVIAPSPLIRTKPWVTGVAKRLATATSGSSSNGADQSPEGVRTTFGLLKYTSGDSELSNHAGSTASPVSDWYLAPAPLMLTYFKGFGAHELDWSIASPARLPGASTIASDRFVRSITAGVFFGYEIALLFPSTCAVGALSDALGRPALVKDALADSGIFTIAKRAAIQDVLVKNGVTMHVRVMANKPQVAVESALANTRCSTANIGECASLLASLNAASSGVVSSVPSDLAKLQADTDPKWSLTRVSTAPMSIVP